MSDFPVKPAVDNGRQILNAEPRGAARRFGQPELPCHHSEITDDSKHRNSCLVQLAEGP